MLKKQLRSKHSKQREKISLLALHSASLVIANEVLKLPIWDYSYYHLFLQIVEKKEIDTSHLLAVLQGKDKNVVIPKVVDNTTLKHYLLTDDTVLKKNSWNVPEPLNGLEVPVEMIDVVFLPLLAFDLSGYRVGYGKGYYDRFLKTCRPEVIRVGLCLFEAVEKITDVEETDVRMNYCVTPKKIYAF